jgi:hypothetical protein
VEELQSMMMMMMMLLLKYDLVMRLSVVAVEKPSL